MALKVGSFIFFHFSLAGEIEKNQSAAKRNSVTKAINLCRFNNPLVIQVLGE